MRRRKDHAVNCLNHGLDGLKDFTDFDPTHQNNPYCLRVINPCNLRNPFQSVIQTKGAHCLNHGLNRLKDYTDYDPINQNNPYNPRVINLCNPRNPFQSVIQTKGADILTAIMEMI